MKKRALTAIFILLSLVLVSAAITNVDLAYSWLINQPNSDVFTASLTALAVSRADASRVQSYTSFIATKKHSSNACWPSENCKVKDSAMALLTESIFGLGLPNTNAGDIENWLISRLVRAPLSGTWNLQILTQDTGTCSLVYKKRGESESSPISLSVNKGLISSGSCSNQYFFDLNSCVSGSIISTPATQIEVN